MEKKTPQTKTRIVPQSPQQNNEAKMAEIIEPATTPQILLHFDVAVKAPVKVRVNDPSPGTDAGPTHAPEFISVQTRKISETPLAQKIQEWRTNMPNDLAQIKITDTLLYIRHSLEKLQKNKITHGDLTLKNVVYDNINHCPIIRNFQLSFQYEPPPPPNQQHPPYNPHFGHICFEAQVVNYLLDHPEKQEINLQELVNQAPENQRRHAEQVVQVWNPRGGNMAAKDAYAKAAQTAPLWDLYSIMEDAAPKAAAQSAAQSAAQPAV